MTKIAYATVLVLGNLAASLAVSLAANLLTDAGALVQTSRVVASPGDTQPAHEGVAAVAPGVGGTWRI